MARFLVKASEFKNICKAVNDRKLAELKKEIIEILKKQDEKEVKKAIDYFNSQELHYTHLEKSFNGKWIEKAGYGIGTVRIWKGKKYKKIAPGKWARVFEKEGRGTNIAIGKLIAKVQKIDNVEDLMAFVMANKQRFVDENGVDLPVLDKLRAAVDARNGNVSASEKKLIKTKDFKKDAAKYKGKTITYKGALYEIGDYELGDMNILPRVWLTQYGDKKRSLDKRTFYKLLEESKETKDEKAELKKNPYSIREMSRSLKFNELIPEYEKQKKILNWDINKKKKEIERKYDFSDFSEEKKNKFLEPKFIDLENQYQAASDNIEYIKNRLKIAMERDGVNDVIEKMKKHGIYEEVKEEKPDENYDSKAYEDEKDNILRHTNKNYDSVDAALKDMYAHKNWIDRKPSDETEHEKTVRESRLKAVDDIIEGLKNGDKKLLDKFVKEEKPAESENPYEMTETEKKGAMKNPKTKLLQLADAVRNTEEGTDEYYTALSVFQNAREEFIENQGMAEYKEIMPDYPKGKSKKPAEKEEESKEYFNNFYKKLIENGDINKIAEMIKKENNDSYYATKIGKDILKEFGKDSKEFKQFVVNDDGIFEPKKEPEKKTKTSKPSIGVFAPSESTDWENKNVIAENKSIGENEVQMPYSKDLAAEMEGLKNCTSKDPTREFMTIVYYKDGNLIATDARRLKTVKVGKLDGIEDGTYVDIDVSRNGINIKKNDFDGQFPNYSRVIPDNLNQKVMLDNDVLKQKIKDMRKDGAIDRKGLNGIQFEFKDGKVYLDDTVVGKADNINLTINTGTWTEPNNEETNYIGFNADYLENALNGKNSVLMLSDKADKAVGISTDSTVNVIMPLQHNNGKMDYSENRKKKAYEQAKKDSVKQANIERNKNLLDGLSEDKVNSLLDGINNSIDERIKTWSDDDLKRAYEKFGLNFNKLLEKPLHTIDTVADKKTGTTLRVAYLHEKLKEKYPEVKEKMAAELEKRGIEVKKSLFDDLFEIDIIANDELEDEEELEEDEENESLFNDYSAEQPELFNSTEMMVREAFNRCRVL